MFFSVFRKRENSFKANNKNQEFGSESIDKNFSEEIFSASLASITNFGQTVGLCCECGWVLSLVLKQRNNFLFAMSND